MDKKVTDFIKESMLDMVHGYMNMVVVDNIKVVYDENPDDPYDSAYEVRKKVNGKWELIDTYYFCKYTKDNFFDYDRMVEDISDCVEQHYEAPKKTSLDGDEPEFLSEEWWAWWASAEWDEEYKQRVRNGELYNRHKNEW